MKKWKQVEENNYNFKINTNFAEEGRRMNKRPEYLKCGNKMHPSLMGKLNYSETENNQNIVQKNFVQFCAQIIWNYFKIVIVLCKLCAFANVFQSGFSFLQEEHYRHELGQGRKKKSGMEI